MDWKEQLRKRALGVLSDPRVTTALSDPRVMQALTNVLKLRTQLKQSVDDGVRQLAKSLNLATEAEVQELRRAVARLERQLEQERQRGESGASGRAMS